MRLKDKKQKKFVIKPSKNESDDEEIEEKPKYTEFEIKIGAAFIFSLSCVIYYSTMFPGLPMGDSGEFMVTGIDFGVAHPPGYPIFTTLTYLIMNIIPLGTPAWRVSLLSVFFGAVFNLTVYYAVSRIGNNCVVGFLTAGWIGFSRLFWMWSIQGEIFSLNNLFCSLIMIRAFYFEQASSIKSLQEAKLSALVCGLSLSNQHTSVLFIFPFALRVAYRLIISEGYSLKTACLVALHGIAGMSCYLQMPISHFFFSPRVTWGDFSSFYKFIRHLLRLDYGSSFKLVAGDTKGTFFSNFVAFVKDSSSELSVLPWALNIFLVYTITCTNTSKIFRRTVTSIILMMACYLAVFCSLANIDTLDGGLDRGVLERFWMQPSIGLMILGGIALCKVIVLLAELIHPAINNKYLQLSLALLVISAQIKRNYRENDESDNLYAYHYAQSILPHLPENSIMLTGGDLPTNVFRYHTICEQIRPDVKVLDLQFMKADWFRDVLAPSSFANIIIPGVLRPYQSDQLSEGQYNIKLFLDSNIDKFPIFVCNNLGHHENRDHEQFYASIPFRTCKQFRKISEIKNPVEALQSTPDLILFEWPMPELRQYEDRTWESTLMRTYLLSLSEKALFLWFTAVKIKHTGNKRYVLEHGLRLISNATDQIDTAIIEGKFDEDVWKYVYANVAKNKGHFCMILYSMRFEAKESPETLKNLEDCVRKYWQIFIDWALFYRKHDELEIVKELRGFLSRRSFSDIKFSI